MAKNTAEVPYEVLLKSITVNNYGPYAGCHYFDISTTPSKSIILIGGLNGGGKTTLFESVLLCLYGRLHAGGSQKTYENRLAKMVHRFQGSGLATSQIRASVMVEFQVYRDGSITEYEVERSWSFHGAGEELRIRKRGQGTVYSDLDLVEQDQWQAFINGLIPRSIANLFFFDGEQVAKMAKLEGVTIQSSFSSLLGLDIVDKLQKDLRTNLVRNLSGDDKHLQEEYSVLENQKAEAEAKAGRLQESRARKEGNLMRIRHHIEDAEERLERLGGGFAEKRLDIKSRLSAERVRLEASGKRITQMCSAELPFSLIPKQMNRVRAQIETEGAAARDAIERGAAIKTIDRIKSAISSDGFLERVTSRDHIMSIISRAVEEARPGPPQNSQEHILGFSTMQQERMLRLIESADGTMLKEAREEAAEYAITRERISGLEEALASAPADDEIGPIVSEIGNMRVEEGRLEAEADHLDRQTASHEALIKNITAKIRDVVKRQYKNKRNHRMISLTKNVQDTLEIYSERLRAEKLSLLESYILETANILMHKKKFIKSVSVDPQTFRVIIHGRDDVTIPHDSLSKGEQQMLATALLWALARTSGRPLPFMIDTPLARLDGEHRINLVERFFQLASHQTLVFSTDTEIVPAYYEKLRPYISRSYTIQYDPESGRTTTREGYFTEE